MIYLKEADVLVSVSFSLFQTTCKVDAKEWAQEEGGKKQTSNSPDGFCQAAGSRVVILDRIPP